MKKYCDGCIHAEYGEVCKYAEDITSWNCPYRLSDYQYGGELKLNAEIKCFGMAFKVFAVMGIGTDIKEITLKRDEDREKSEALLSYDINVREKD